MNKKHLQNLMRECDGFMDFINVSCKPALIFVNKKNVQEFFVNNMYEPSNTVYFNIEFIKKLDYRYTLLLLLHEIYHVTKQGIVNFHDVTFMRDSKQWHIMQLADVEADLQVAAYLKEMAILPSFPQYLFALHCGNRVFHNNIMRHPKLERFIGSICSIAMLYKENRKVVYLPQLTYNSALYIIIDFHTHQIKIDNSPFDTNNLEKWIETFQNASLMTQDQYVATLVTISENIHNSIKGEKYEA